MANEEELGGLDSVEPEDLPKDLWGDKRDIGVTPLPAGSGGMSCDHGFLSPCSSRIQDSGATLTGD
jgi:hypothetical protein